MGGRVLSLQGFVFSSIVSFVLVPDSYIVYYIIRELNILNICFNLGENDAVAYLISADYIAPVYIFLIAFFSCGVIVFGYEFKFSQYLFF